MTSATAPEPGRTPRAGNATPARAPGAGKAKPARIPGAGKGPLDRALAVGELARATGLTVRTLHHYDRLGLLPPGRDTTGRRRYRPAEVRRLHQIVALRGFGPPLAEIAQLLTGVGCSPESARTRCGSCSAARAGRGADRRGAMAAPVAPGREGPPWPRWTVRSPSASSLNSRPAAGRTPPAAPAAAPGRLPSAGLGRRPAQTLVPARPAVTT